MGCRVFPRGRRRLLGYDVEDVDLVAGPAEVGERPVHHVLRLRVPVDGYENLAQRWLALLAGVGVLRSLLGGGGEGIERRVRACRWKGRDRLGRTSTGTAISVASSASRARFSFSVSTVLTMTPSKDACACVRGCGSAFV